MGNKYENVKDGQTQVGLFLSWDGGISTSCAGLLKTDPNDFIVKWKETDTIFYVTTS